MQKKILTFFCLLIICLYGVGIISATKITQTTNDDGTVNLNLETIDELNNVSENQESTSSEFTGSVIGFAKSSGGIATGIILLIGLIGGIVFFNFKKRNIKKVSKEVDEKSEKEDSSEKIKE